MNGRERARHAARVLRDSQRRRRESQLTIALTALKILESRARLRATRRQRV